uniref:Kinesin motor domain-containing protein n=1 Tax=Brugia timori TaxID=42155 RepID=A0A0R3QJD3_9BILA
LHVTVNILDVRSSMTRQLLDSTSVATFRGTKDDTDWSRSTRLHGISSSQK